MGTIFAASTHPDRADSAYNAETEVEVVFVDRTPEDYDPEVVEAFRVFAGEYTELAAELFDCDQDLTSRVQPRDLETI